MPSPAPALLGVDTACCQCVEGGGVSILWSQWKRQREFLARAPVLFQPSRPAHSNIRNDCAMVQMEKPRGSEPHSPKICHIPCASHEVVWLRVVPSPPVFVAPCPASSCTSSLGRPKSKPARHVNQVHFIEQIDNDFFPFIPREPEVDIQVPG